MGETLTFTATGSPQVVSRAIEEYARTQGHVTAIVVPWESDATTLRMAVTAVFDRFVLQVQRRFHVE